MITEHALYPPGYTVMDYSTLPVKDRKVIAAQVAKLERKVFPSGEGFNYDAELKKSNTRLFFVIKDGSPTNVVAYLVYQRIKRLVWLHKLCVSEPERRKGLGRCLIHSLHQQVQKGGGCDSIQIWVDEFRQPARTLYEASGFQQLEYRHDYYAPGRSGLKMSLELEQ